MSEPTAKLLENNFELEPRGEIEVKGKGPMRTFFVRSWRPDAITHAHKMRHHGRASAELEAA